jgi:hypothetical protein
MTERQQLNKLTAQIKKLQIPHLYWYKLGDTYGGHKKPCDVMGHYEGKAFMAEFKSIKEFIKPGMGLSDFQSQELHKNCMAGGTSFLGVFNYKNIDFYLTDGIQDGEGTGFIFSLDAEKTNFGEFLKWIKKI